MRLGLDFWVWSYMPYAIFDALASSLYQPLKPPRKDELQTDITMEVRCCTIPGVPELQGLGFTVGY